MVHYWSSSLSSSAWKNLRSHVCCTLRSGSRHGSDESHPRKDCYGCTYWRGGFIWWAHGHFASKATSYISRDIFANHHWWTHWKVGGISLISKTLLTEKWKILGLLTYFADNTFHSFTFHLQCGFPEWSCGGILVWPDTESNHASSGYPTLYSLRNWQVSFNQGCVRLIVFWDKIAQQFCSKSLVL